MLQNRVDPFGNIIKTTARGAWMGNRGLIHNDRQEIVRPFKLTAWITCRLEFKGWKRKVMSPGKYTELFFMDEATAFSAGHRPCSECRREDAKKFKSAWIKGNPEYGFDEKTSIRMFDAVMHGERLGPGLSKPLFEEPGANIPDGCFVSRDEQAFLVAGAMLFPWSPFGYGDPIAIKNGGVLNILTPKSIVNAIRAGYAPQTALQ